jgi:trehalose 6-phosphate phosphatase
MNGRKAMPDYLFDSTNNIFEKIDKSDVTFLFIDYDGTLVSFKDKPKDVNTPQEVKTILTCLLEHPKFKVFIVSGRTLIEIKELLNINGLSFAALHGLKIELSNGKKFFWEQAENIRSILKEIKIKALNEFKNKKEIYIEDKKVTLAFHYRLLSNNRIKKTVEKFEKIVKEIDANNMLNIINGEKVIEIRPKGWNKGKAVELILKNISEKINFLPIYIGDDTTDEDAFKQLEKKGITIFVTNDSNNPTTAHYYLKNPDDVIIFLQNLSKIEK